MIFIVVALSPKKPFHPQLNRNVSVVSLLNYTCYNSMLLPCVNRVWQDTWWTTLGRSTQLKQSSSDTVMTATFMRVAMFRVAMIQLYRPFIGCVLLRRRIVLCRAEPPVPQTQIKVKSYSGNVIATNTVVSSHKSSNRRLKSFVLTFFALGTTFK